MLSGNPWIPPRSLEEPKNGSNMNKPLSELRVMAGLVHFVQYSPKRPGIRVTRLLNYIEGFDHSARNSDWSNLPA